MSLSLHQAAQSGDIASVLALLEQGENVNALDETGTPPIYHAVWNNRMALLRVLLDNRADVDQSIGYNTENDFAPLAWTALHAAAEKNNTEAAQLLLKYGANVNAADQFGRTPLFASLDEVVGPDVAKILILHSANVNARSYDSSPIDSARIYGRPDLEQLLKDAGAEDIKPRNLHTSESLIFNKLMYDPVSKGLDRNADGNE
jgi:ankyrin repeat protein